MLVLCLLSQLKKKYEQIVYRDQRCYAHIISLDSVDPHGPFIPDHVSRQLQSPRDHLAL